VYFLNNTAAGEDQIASSESTGLGLLSLPRLHLLQVELEFSTLQDVAVAASALAARHGGQQAARHELLLQSRFNLGLTLADGVLLLRLLRPLLVQDGLLGFSQLGTLLAAKSQGVVGFIPLSERGGINNNNGVLHQGLGAHQFVVGGIVDHIDDPSLASASL